MTAFLYCVQLMIPTNVESEKQQQEAETEPVDQDSTWKKNDTNAKLARPFTTSDASGHGEWAGFILVGRDLNTLWLTTKGSAQQGETDSAEIRLFYSRTIRPYLGVQLGWRRDFKPKPQRDWLGFGLLAVLPYKVGADASFFIGESDRIAARLEIAYQHRFTQKLSLTPDFEANFYSEDDPERDIGSGLSDLDLGLRVRYQIIRGVSPYTGITWKGNFGNTADMIKSKGEDTSDLRIMLGVTLQY